MDRGTVTIFGVDLSDFDHGRGPVDVAAMKADGITFLSHKATEGTNVRHAYYGAVLNAARAASVEFVGAYIVPRTPGNNGHGSIAAQVAYFLAYLDAQTPWWRTHPGFFVQVDTEHWGYDDVAPTHGAQACDLLRAQTGKWVVHYAPRWAYGDTIPGNDPLWSSAYGGNPAQPYPQAYRGDGDPALWSSYSGRVPTFGQYGSRVTIGNQPGCDINAYRGTITQLRALITGGTDDMAGASDIISAWSGGFDHTPDGTTVEPVKWRLRDEAWQASVNARLDADAVRDQAMQAAVDGLVAAIRTGGGSVDAVPIVAAVNAVRDEAREQFAALHAENAKLQAQVAAYQAKAAAAAKAAADALAPTAG